jgi:hypothetical protein
MDSLTRNLFILAAIVALIVFPLIYYIFVGSFNPPFKDLTTFKENLVWGVSFSTHYAKDILGLDWQQAYQAMFDELKVRYVRIPVYWTEIEPQSGNYDFSSYDWMLQKAAENGAHVVLAIGQKLPRWPECFVPDWAAKLDAKKKEEAILNYLKKTVERYRGDNTVEAWQIENEPFFNAFGGCPALSMNFFDREVALVRSLDGRPIVVTDSGELGFWVKAARKADVFGSTLYRQVSNYFLGDVINAWPAMYYRFKVSWVNVFAPGRRIWDIELQAEPWSLAILPDTTLEKQLQLMNKKIFIENVKFAASIDFSRHYLWVTEWWYWLKKVHGDFEMWDSARTLFVDGYDAFIKQ